MDNVWVRYVMLAIGGSFGTIARYEISRLVQARFPGDHPWGTFFVNVSGCLVMGFATSLLSERFPVVAHWRYLVLIGFLGAYTTFSTFALDLFRAHTSGAWLVAGAYLIGSVACGYVALWAGIMLGRAI